MKVELSKEARTASVASIKRYAEENLAEAMGDLAAGSMLDFFLEEIGPAIYNSAIADAQVRLQQRVSDLNGELYADEFLYWARLDARRKGRR